MNRYNLILLHKTKRQNMESQKFKVCNGRHASSGSPYPKEQVPLTLFKKNRFGEYASCCKYCLDR